MKPRENFNLKEGSAQPKKKKKKKRLKEKVN